jgi:predicted aconitase
MRANIPFIVRNVYDLTSASENDVDFVSIGCPHCSLQQIKQVALMLSGKKVDKGVNLWVYTSAPIRSLAEKLGYLGIIENAGGIVTSDICTIVGCPEALGFKCLATNSSKMAFYSPGSNKLGAWLGSTKQCIDAAVKGKWEA